MFKYLKSSLLLILLGMFLTNSTRAECPPGDFDGSCKVDMEDLRIFSEQWLDEESIQADIDDLAGINFGDYAVLAENWLQKGTHLLINEIMASNNSVYEDPDNSGEYSDWIEIYNASNEAIDMSGMYLTDNLEDPMQWRIPDGVVLGANDYLVVLADLLNYQDIALHTNFKLGAGGEQVGLYHPDGVTLVDGVDFDQIEQYTDISYGLDANGVMRFFGNPTPVAENNDAYLGLVADTTFSRDRGFYDTSFDVEIECETPGADIYYSVDFNKPDQVTGTEYTSPISVTGTTCIRAMAFKPGWKPTNVDTHTYIFLDDVILQDTAQALARGFPDPWEHLLDPYESLTSHPSDYDMQYENPPGRALVPDMATLKAALKSIPTISIVLDMYDIFDPNTGFYVNSWLYGVAWEREASVEYFDAAGNEEFQINCGIRAQGNQNRRPYRTPKHSMRLRFKKDYGPTKLNYPIFKDSPVDRFDSLTLRGGGNDSWHVYGSRRSSYARDKWGHETMHEAGLTAPYGNFVHLYLNGLYWGLYNPVERPDAPFYAEHMGGEKEEWEANNAGLPIAGQTPADLVVWNTVQSYFGGGTITDTQYDEVSEWLDMPVFCDYLLVYYYGGAGDWGSYNFYAAAKPGSPGQPPEVGLRFSTWDFEEAIGLYDNPTTDITGKTGTVGINRICERIRGNAKFQKLFADRTHKLLYNGGPLTDARCIARFEGLNSHIEQAIYGEIVRWGDVDNTSWPVDHGEWQGFQDYAVSNWFTGRRNVLLGQLRNRGLYPDTDAPVFNINGSYQHGGYVSEGSSLTMTNPNGSGTIYYTVDGNDPWDYDGTGGVPPTYTTLIEEDASKKVLVPSGPIANWNELGFTDTGWNHGTPNTPGKAGGVGYEMVSGYQDYITYDVNTVMFGVNPSCYIRVAFTLNENPGDYDGLELRMRYDDGFVAYINGVEATRDGFSGTPAWNSACNWRSDSTSFVVFDVTSSLGELVQGQNVLAIQGMNAEAGSSDFLCSVELVASTGGSGGGGGGVSASAIEYTGAITLSESTQVKARVLSTLDEWSATNEATYAIGPVADNLRITEMMYHPANAPLGDPNAEFVEVKNVGGTALKLNLVKFTEGIHFTFP
ncbi:MAG: chitobiase/beta-hexosaminidase C-terminal domain-containing protein, partial [Planctomycetota bacterium]